MGKDEMNKGLVNVGTIGAMGEIAPNIFERVAIAPAHIEKIIHEHRICTINSKLRVNICTHNLKFYNGNLNGCIGRGEKSSIAN